MLLYNLNLVGYDLVELIVGEANSTIVELRHYKFLGYLKTFVVGFDVSLGMLCFTTDSSINSTSINNTHG